MNELVLTTDDLVKLRSELLSSEYEQCAILFASEAYRTGGSFRLLVRDILLPTESDYSVQTNKNVELKPDFVARITKRARKENQSLVFVHTHLGYNRPSFSHIDDQGELTISAFLSHRIPDIHHASLVISNGGMCARVLGTDEYLRVISVGQRRVVEYDPGTGQDIDINVFDRQIRAFGTEGQKTLQGLRIAIVGLGGTGSILSHQLVHLGVRDFILIDPDIVEKTNLNRIVGATLADIGIPKVDVSKRYITTFSSEASVECVPGDVVYASTARKLFDADIIFGCTDSHGSRAVIQQVSYQYLIPCLDIGSTITTDQGCVSGIFGRVQLLGPGEPCLWCSNLLSSEEVRRDMMNEYERKVDPYIQGAHEPAPSVISLNGTVVSLAVTMLLGLTTFVPIDSRHIIYNAVTSTLRPVRAHANDNCFICSRSGVLAKGDSQPLLARLD